MWLKCSIVKILKIVKYIFRKFERFVEWKITKND